MPDKPKRVHTAAVVKLEWEEPPAGGRRGVTPLRERLADPLAELEAHPGRWARIVEYASPTAGNSAAGTLRKQLGAGWEFRGVRDGTTSYLYARYTGNPG